MMYSIEQHLKARTPRACPWVRQLDNLWYEYTHDSVTMKCKRCGKAVTIKTTDKYVNPGNQKIHRELKRLWRTLCRKNFKTILIESNHEYK